MTTEKIRKLYSARPFHPFTINMADGRAVTIGHPEWMLISPSGRTVTVEDRDENQITIDLLLATSVEVKKNGKSKSSKNH